MKGVKGAEGRSPLQVCSLFVLNSLSFFERVIHRGVEINSQFANHFVLIVFIFVTLFVVKMPNYTAWVAP